MRAVWKYLFLCPLFFSMASLTHAQTPSPLQEWQYSGGIILARLFEPDLPRFRTILGVAAEVQPVYDGSRAYHVQGGPVINIQYKDIAFISTGDGLGYNVLRGDHYQVGISISYDLGRKMKDDLTNLRGLGDISAAPVPKLYGTWVLSKKFPLVLRTDVRQWIGGAGGATADAGVYIPLPGSSRRLVMFLGPSISFATRLHLQNLYGVNSEQSLASGRATYDVSHSGESAVGVGFSATKFLGTHWLVNLDAAINQLRGEYAGSPLIERHTQRILAVSLDYNW